jgi:hypothetical protein
MKTDPLDACEIIVIRSPPAHGPGSGKTAWKELAQKLMTDNKDLWSVIKGQHETIRDLEAEVRLLREQIATRKPKGGREGLPQETVNQIEQAIEAGQSTRTIGARFRVSPMTVSRVRKRMLARQASSA